MDPIYLLAIVRKTRDKSSKLTRIAKCRFDRDAFDDSCCKVGEWWKLEIYDNPIPGCMFDLLFVSLSADPCIVSARYLQDRLVSYLSRPRGQKWEVEACGPIDADDAVSLRIELEVV